MDHKLSFRGTTKEYFGIWIVNTLLTIVTLGVYSAWAKVRRRRYLAGCILLDDEPFEYLAQPLAIFRGWLIAAAAILLYWFAGRVGTTLSVAVTLGIAALLPWVVVKSRIFNARNRSYRNIRFGYAPNYREAYRVLLGLSLLIPLTLGILAPYVMYRQKRFQVENTSFGTTPFRFTARPGEFYKLFLFAFLWLAGAAFAASFLIGVTGIRRSGWHGAVLLASLLPIAAYFVFMVYVKTELANLAWNRTELGTLRFSSSMQPLTVFWLYLTGAAAVLLSLGLLYPWASLRLMRYRCGQLTVRSEEGIGRFVADTAAADAGAAGEEIGDLIGLDLDIAF